MCKELESARERHVLEKEQAVLEQQEIVAALKKELEALKLVRQTQCRTICQHDY